MKKGVRSSSPILSAEVVYSCQRSGALERSAAEGRNNSPGPGVGYQTVRAYEICVVKAWTDDNPLVTV
jgi:hypothetical protein